MTLKRVLIVEDMVDVGRFYQEAIRSAFPGAPIVFVPSAEEGLLEATRYAINLLVTDIRLPGMSGFDLVRKIRARQPEIKVIMVTGLMVDGDLRRQSREVGADVLLAKPLSLADLLSAVENATGEKAQAGAAAQMTTPTRRSGRTTGGLRRAVNEPKTDSPSKQAVETKTAVELETAVKSEAEPLLPTPKAAVEPEAEPSHLTLGSALGDLRGSLGALAAILLDDQGRTVAKAGEWPAAELEAKLVPEVMAGLNGLEKISHRLRPGLPVSVHALRGRDYDLSFAPVGRFALLVFLKADGGALRLALVFEQLLAAQAQFAGILEGMGLVIRPVTGMLPALSVVETVATPMDIQLVAKPETAAQPEPEPETEDPSRLNALAALLGDKPQPAGEQDVDSFWDQATSGEKPSAPTTGALSYEQAQKLGLVGDEK